MSIQYCAGPEKAPGLDPVADILIILGDYWPVGNTEAFVTRLVSLLERGWKHVVYVSGVLEADRLEYEAAVDYLWQLDAKLDNFHFLHNTHVDLAEYKMRIFGTPLFTDMAANLDMDTEEGQTALCTALPINAWTNVTNEAFGLPAEGVPEDHELLPHQNITEATDGTKHLVVRLTNLWWMKAHQTARAALGNAIIDSTALPEDWAFVVATHYQPSPLLDDEKLASDEKIAALAHLRFCTQLPLEQYARLSNRPIVWLYAQALEYGRANTGVTSLDSAFIFQGTPSTYMPGQEAHVLDLLQLPAGTSAQAADLDAAVAAAQAAAGSTGKGVGEGAMAEDEVTPEAEAAFEARMQAALAGEGEGSDNDDLTPGELMTMEEYVLAIRETGKTLNPCDFDAGREGGDAGV